MRLAGGAGKGGLLSALQMKAPRKGHGKYPVLQKRSANFTYEVFR